MGWTDDNHLRHSKLIAVREDKRRKTCDRSKVRFGNSEDVHPEHNIHKKQCDYPEDDVAYPLAGSFGIGVGHPVIVCVKDEVNLVTVLEPADRRS